MKHLFVLIAMLINPALADQFPGSQCYDWQEGSTRSGFLQSVVHGDFPCQTGTQTCTNGLWVGPILYDFCEQINKSCGGTPHGTTITGYLEPWAMPGMECTIASKTCIDGAWVGPEVYPSCMKNP